MALKPSPLASPWVFAALAVLASLALSLWKIHFTPVVNVDAILYLIATETLLNDGIDASLGVYSWPFFQLSIAAIHQVTGFELLTCAQILMATCFALVTLAFCRAVQALGGEGKTLWLALAVALCHTELIDARDSLLRDPGMIAFVLLGLAEQLRFADTGRWRHCLLWLAAMAVAFLFRVEALAIAALAPLALLTLPGRPLRERLILTARLACIPAAASLLLLVLLPGGDQHNIKLVQDLNFMVGEFQGFATKLEQLSQVIATQVLETFSARDAELALVGMILTITLVNILRAITLPYLALLAATWLTRTAPALRGRFGVVWWYGLVVFSYLLTFALFVQFSLTRYSLLLALLVLLPLPFYLRHWWDNSPRRSLARGLIAFALFAGLADGLISSAWKKTYIRDATRWVATSPQIPAGTLVTNEPYLGYFSGKSTTDLVIRAINPGREPQRETIDRFWLPGHTYAHRVPRGDRAQRLLADIGRGGGTMLRQFEGEDGRNLYLFTVAVQTPRSPELLEYP